MEKFDKLETTNSVDNIKPKSETKTINQEDYVKKQQEREEEEYYDKLKEDWTPEYIDNKYNKDLDEALYWLKTNNTKELEHTLKNSVEINNRWWNFYTVSSAQIIPPPPENMEIPQ